MEQIHFSGQFKQMQKSAYLENTLASHHDHSADHGRLSKTQPRVMETEDRENSGEAFRDFVSLG